MTTVRLGFHEFFEFVHTPTNSLYLIPNDRIESVLGYMPEWGMTVDLGDQTEGTQNKLKEQAVVRIEFKDVDAVKRHLALLSYGYGVIL